MGPPPALSFPPPNREPSPAPGNPISTPGHYGGPAWRVSKWSAPPAQTAGVFFASRIAPSARGPQSRRGAPMPDGIRWVGLDVYAHESTIAIFAQGTGELTTRRVVCGPGRGDRALTERVKTDKRDAIRLARRLAAGELTLVTVPSVEHEQLRDLVRCREDIRGDLMRARHRLGKFLLRREIYYEGPATAWTQKNRAWLASLRFADMASRLTIADYLHAHDLLLARRDRIEAELEQLAACSPWTQTIARLRCLRGIDTLSALGLCAEIGEFDRFEHPDSLSAYLGIVPSENTTGERRRQGSITKAGSTHARRLLMPPTTTSAPPRSAERSSAANAANHPTSSTSPGGSEARRVG